MSSPKNMKIDRNIAKELISTRFLFPTAAAYWASSGSNHRCHRHLPKSTLSPFGLTKPSSELASYKRGEQEAAAIGLSRFEIYRSQVRTLQIEFLKLA